MTFNDRWTRPADRDGFWGGLKSASSSGECWGVPGAHKRLRRGYWGVRAEDTCPGTPQHLLQTPLRQPIRDPLQGDLVV